MGKHSCIPFLALKHTSENRIDVNTSRRPHGLNLGTVKTKGGAKVESARTKVSQSRNGYVYTKGSKERAVYLRWSCVAVTRACLTCIHKSMCETVKGVKM
mmetsp:Transcript_33652/g.86230  ORF Transcript_33652/g.86230 Transcript_33652/m.86230 type:complete len:100 (-) Transcript_33652:1679-1978(-)